MTPNNRLREARERLPSPAVRDSHMSRPELADLLNQYLYQAGGQFTVLTGNYVGKLERGQIRWPQEGYRKAFRAVLAAETDAELGLERPRRGLPSLEAARSSSEFSSLALPQTSRVRSSRPTTEGDDVQRREFSALAAGSLVHGVFELVTREPVLFRKSIERRSAADGTVRRLTRIADQLGTDAIHKPPKMIMPRALGAFRDVRTLFEDRQTTSVQVQLLRLGAKLNIVMGESLFNTGYFDIAREYYTAGYDAAADAGDRYLCDIALAGQCYLPWYSDNPGGVLAIVGPRLSGRAESSPGVAWLWAAAARAHSALGDRKSYNRAIEMSKKSLAESRPDLIRPGIFSTEPVLVGLDKATALALTGDADAGCNLACATLTDNGVFHGITVRKRAARFENDLRQMQTSTIGAFSQIRRELHSAEKVNLQ